MKKKWLKIGLLLILPLMVGMACVATDAISSIFNRASDELTDIVPTDIIDIPETVITEPVPTEELVETLEPVDGEEQDLRMLEKDFWYQEEGAVYLAFYFENPNADILFEEIEYTVFLYDANGAEIQTDSAYIRYLFPASTFGVSDIVYLDDETALVDSISIEWTYVSGAAEGFSNPFTAEDVMYWDNGGSPGVTGKIVNSLPDTYVDILVNVILLDSNDEIVGSGYTYVDFVPGSDFMGFVSSVDAFADVSSVEIYPTFTSTSYYYEGEEFWSEITILDDNFFLDEYGYVLGGLVVQNNLDTALSNSIAYVTFYDDNDAVTSVANYTIEMLLPGDTVGIAPWASSPPDGSVTTTYDVLVLPGDYEDDYELASNPFTVNSAEITGDYDNYVTVNFTNGYSKSLSEVNVNVLIYDTEGYIIGGGYSWQTDPIAAGSTSEIEIWVDYDQTVDVGSIEAWVYPNSWTEFE
jgi:hypothetical protein